MIKNDSAMSLEMLPDEIILTVCSYLRQLDILQAFNDLNIRLNCTISHYRKHMDLTQSSADQFMSFCQKLLQSTLGVAMQSVILTKRKPLVKQMSLFEKQMRPLEVNLPNLTALALTEQSIEEIDLLLSNFLFLPKLEELKLGIASPYSSGDHQKSWASDLFTKLTTEKNQLQKITFRSISFSVNYVALPSINNQINKTVTHLTISLNTTDDLILIIHGFSSLQYLDVCMEKLNMPDTARSVMNYHSIVEKVRFI
jgi:hypothetical protein